MLSLIQTALMWFGGASLAGIGVVGGHAIIKKAITAVGNDIKEGMAAKHVTQAIAEFKANHPEIAALYNKKV